MVIVAQFSMGWSFQSTAPAFMWSSHQDRYSFFFLICRKFYFAVSMNYARGGWFDCGCCEKKCFDFKSSCEQCLC